MCVCVFLVYDIITIVSTTLSSLEKHHIILDEMNDPLGQVKFAP